ncbi:MAG: hypothetical protein R3C49_17980 [Planctomycetaceae bacterium]
MTSGEYLEARTLLTAYVVNTIEDGSLVSDGFVSLREAIEAANTNAAFLDAAAGEAGPGATDTIVFDPILNGQTITLGGTSLVISDSLMISDNNALPVSIDAAGNSRVFDVVSGSGLVSIANVTIAGGSDVVGGGIRVAGGESLVLDAVTVRGNTATGNSSTEGGGGLFNDGGDVTITNSTITANSASGTSGSGGGIFSTSGSVSIAGSTISLNSATRAGGGIELISGDALLTTVNLINNDVDGTAGAANPGNGGGVHISGAAAFTMDGGSGLGTERLGKAAVCGMVQDS